MHSVEDIGCCGAFCGTCPVIAQGACKGCKTGYSDGERDLAKARCKMKKCCLSKAQETCADCRDYSECAILGEFFGKKGYKYVKYREALDFIRANGYEAFLKKTEGWSVQYGRYK